MNLEKQFSEIVLWIEQTKQQTIQNINRNLINLYWQIGEYISQKVNNAEWGKNIVQNLATYLQEELPETKGFSAQNLWRMKQFYETYNNSTKLSTLLRELPWSSHLHLC
jgi:hypothetical protein